MLQERRRDEKDDIGYAILDYYSAQYSLGDWFDVNMKVYSITFFLKQQRVSSTKNKNNTVALLPQNTLKFPFSSWHDFCSSLNKAYI